MINTLLLSFILYLVIASLLLYIKPNILFNDKNIKRFGRTSDFRTIVPLWLVFMILGIISYAVSIFVCSKLK